MTNGRLGKRNSRESMNQFFLQDRTELRCLAFDKRTIRESDHRIFRSGNKCAYVRTQQWYSHDEDQWVDNKIEWTARELPRGCLKHGGGGRQPIILQRLLFYFKKSKNPPSYEYCSLFLVTPVARNLPMAASKSPSTPLASPNFTLSSPKVCW